MSTLEAACPTMVLTVKYLMLLGLDDKVSQVTGVQNSSCVSGSKVQHSKIPSEHLVPPSQTHFVPSVHIIPSSPQVQHPPLEELEELEEEDDDELEEELEVISPDEEELLLEEEVDPPEEDDDELEEELEVISLDEKELLPEDDEELLLEDDEELLLEDDEELLLEDDEGLLLEKKFDPLFFLPFWVFALIRFMSTLEAACPTIVLTVKYLMSLALNDKVSSRSIKTLILVLPLAMRMLRIEMPLLFVNVIKLKG